MKYFIFVFVFLIGCAGKTTLPEVEEVVLHDNSQSLYDICFSMEQFTLKVGFERLSRREKKVRKELEEQLATTPTHAIFREDMASIIQTVYALPIKSYDDVEAVARLVYQRCINQNV